MGIFNKNKVSQSEADRAANAFAARDKKPTTDDSGGGNMVDRILGSNDLGADRVRPKPSTGTPVDRIAELRAEQERRKSADAGHPNAKAESASKLAANAAIAARQNNLSSANISKDKIPKQSAEERAANQAQGMAHLGSIVDNYKNKHFMTAVEKSLDEGVEKKAENLSDEEVLRKTGKIRNQGFITEVEVDNREKRVSASQKLDDDLADLEKVDKAISSFTNTGFKKQNAGGDMSENIGDLAEEEEGE